MKRLSASKFDLAIQCQYWLRDEVEFDDKPGRSARCGNALHKLIEHYIERDKQHAGPKIELPTRGKPGKSAA